MSHFARVPVVRRYLDMDISLEQSSLYNWIDYVSGLLLKLADGLRRLFLVEDLVDSLKVHNLHFNTDTS